MRVPTSQSIEKRKSSMKKNNTLNGLIYNSYLTSSLIPIFAIELVLLVLYFGVSYFITDKSQKILFEQAQNSLIEISEREAGKINNQFREVSHISQIMRRDHERFFAHSGPCILPNGEPVLRTHENGALFKPVDNEGSSIYYAATTPIGDQELKKARCSEVIDPLLKSIVLSSPMITQAYLNTHDDLNRIYPYMPDAPAQYGPDLHMEDYNFYYLADSAHNPQKEDVWTGAYLDPAGQGWMISNITPIYRGDFLEGVSGLDVTIDSLIRNVLALEIPWKGSAFLVDGHGMILAMPESVERILKLKELKSHVYQSSVETTVEKPEEYNLLKSPNEQIRRQMETIIDQSITLGTFLVGDQRYMLSQQSIPETDWRLMILLDESSIYEPVNELKAQANLIGYIVIALMAFFYVVFFLYLLKKSDAVARRIANPIEKLSALTTGLGHTPGNRIDHEVGIVEVDALVSNFNDLSAELDARTKDYIQSQIREKMREKDAEIAYRAGLFESASSYLHNIGNALTTLDAKTRMLRNVVKALEKSGLGIKKSIEMVRKSHAEPSEKEQIDAYLTAFGDALSTSVTAEISELTEGIDDIKQHAVDSIRHQQDIFNASNETTRNYVQQFDLADVLENLADDYQIRSRAKGITLTLDVPAPLEVTMMKFQLVSGLSNVIKNGIESIEASHLDTDGRLEIKAFRQDDTICIEVLDNGTGIDPALADRIFKAGYTTKKTGHGLGLHAFNNFLNANGGAITLQSEGVGKGTLVRIIIRSKS
jgi:signal transduction histidine kinase